MAGPVKAIARVQVTIEIHLDQPWGEDSLLGEAHRQAKAQALERIRYLQHADGVLTNIHVVGVPLVQVVTFEEPEK